jgi:hypothetical protein
MKFMSKVFLPEMVFTLDQTSFQKQQYAGSPEQISTYLTFTEKRDENSGCVSGSSNSNSAVGYGYGISQMSLGINGDLDLTGLQTGKTYKVVLEEIIE